VSVLNRKLIRDLLASKAQICAVMSIIAIGIACMVGMYQTYYNLTVSQISYYSQCRMADFWVDIKKAPDNIIKELENIKGISDLRQRILFPVIVDIKNISRPISGVMISMPETQSDIINDIVIKSGTYFTNDDEDEVIISEKFSEARGIYPGDYINIIMNGIEKKLFVTGTAISSEYLFMTPPGGMAPDPMNFGVFWIKETFAEDIFSFHGSFNNLIGKIATGSGYEQESALNEIKEILKPYGVYSVTPLSEQFSNMTLLGELGGLQLMAVAMPIVFLGLAIMVLNIIMIRMAEQQRLTIGTLKAIGYSDKNILMYNLKYGFLIGLAGGIGGVLLGYYFASCMTNIYKSFFTFSHLDNHLCMTVYLLAILLSVTFAVLGAAKGADSMIKLSPAEAMRLSPPQKCSRLFIERITVIWSRLGFMWQHVIRSVFRNPFRSSVGFICAAIGTAIIVMSLGMKDALDYMLYFQYTLSNKADYVVYLRDEAPIDIINDINKNSTVSKTVPEFIIDCTLTHGQYSHKAAIEGLVPNKTLVAPYTIKGEKVKIPTEGILLCKRISEKLHASTGDTVAIFPVKGYQNPIEVKVAGVFETTFGLPVYADFNYLNKIAHQESSVSMLQIKAQQTEAQKQYFLKSLKDSPLLQSVSVVEENKIEMENNFIGQMKGMIYSLIFFAAIIFFASILNSALISISERKIEIATFKVLGYHNSEVGKLFLREILLINIPGIIVGLPLGYLFLLGICSSYKNEMYSIPVHLSDVTWFISLIIAIIFVYCAYLITRKAIGSLNWQDALKIKQ